MNNNSFEIDMASMIAGTATQKTADPYIPKPVTVHDLPKNFKVAPPASEAERLFEQINGESLASIEKACAPRIPDSEIDRSNRVAEAILTGKRLPEYVIPRNQTITARDFKK